MSVEMFLIGMLFIIVLLQAWGNKLQSNLNHDFNERLEKLENDGWQ